MTSRDPRLGQAASEGVDVSFWCSSFKPPPARLSFAALARSSSFPIIWMPGLPLLRTWVRPGLWQFFPFRDFRPQGLLAVSGSRHTMVPHAVTLRSEGSTPRGHDGRAALLLGSQCFGLTGVDHDVKAMAASLTERRSRSRFVPALTFPALPWWTPLATFARRTHAGDAVVLYYSGHGGRVALPDWKARQREGKPAFAHFLVPADIEESTASDFKGLTDAEMSQFQWQLVDITHNVTTILDCCHSGTMARDLSLVAKSKDTDFPQEAVDGLVDRLAGTPARADSTPTSSESSPAPQSSRPTRARVLAAGAGTAHPRVARGVAGGRRSARPMVGPHI